MIVYKILREKRAVQAFGIHRSGSDAASVSVLPIKNQMITEQPFKKSQRALRLIVESAVMYTSVLLDA